MTVAARSQVVQSLRPLILLVAVIGLFYIALEVLPPDVVIALKRYLSSITIR